MKRKRILSQDKDNKGKLGKATVRNVVAKFKEQYLGIKESIDSPLAGFELNGGDGMTQGGQMIWDEFSSWCEERNLDCEYNTREELQTICNTLRVRVENKNINRL